MEKRKAGRLVAVIGILALGAVVGTRSLHAPVRGVSVASPAMMAATRRRAPAPTATVPTTAAPVATTRPATRPVPDTTAPTVAPVVPVASARADIPAYRPAPPAGPARVAYTAVAPSNPLAGLDPLPAGWVAGAHTIVVGGLSRTYLTVAPQTLTGHPPVIVLMHGLLMNATGILDVTGLADRTGPAVIVAPDGWHHSWNAGGCCGPAYRAGINDVAFIRAALAQVLAANPAADPARVYAVGFSNGGRMAYRLACDLPGSFAGFLAAEAVPVQGCLALHPLGITIVAQQDDPLLSVDANQAPKRMDGSVEPTVASTVSRWRALDGCSGDPTLTYAGVAEIHRWSCAGGTHLTYVWYPGGSHSWRRPNGATPGTTDFVLNLMGGQRLTDRVTAPA